MIFTSAINDINWSTIEDFCNQRVPEGTFLDYKEFIPPNLQKTIASFANTFGGVILIGIEEDNSNKPVLPIKGIEFERGLSEKIVNIVLTHITPPFIPEIKICQNSDGKRAIIFIRIPQSDTFHAISRNTEVYLRTNDISHPEKIATIDEVDWLINKRNKSIDLKNSLLNQSKSRFEVMRKITAKNNIELYRSLGTRKNELEISILPVYPMNWYYSPNDLYTNFDKIKIADSYGTCRTFPLSSSSITGNEINILQDGIFLIHNLDTRFFYTEINSYGLYYYRQIVETINHNNQDYLRISEIISRIKSSLIFASSLFKEIGYFGLIEINIRLENLRGYGLFYEVDNRHTYTGFCPDNDFSLNKKILVQDFENQIINTMDFVNKRIGWLFGLYLAL